MKTGPVKEHVQQVSTRICYAEQIHLDDPYKLLAMAIVMQACLDCINYGGQRNYVDFLRVYDQYAKVLGFGVLPEQFMELVYENRHKWSDGRAQKFATSYMLRN